MDNTTNYWSLHIEDFCESVDGSPSDYVRSFSNIATLAIALIGIYRSKLSSILFRTLYSLLFVKSLGSFGYYWTYSFGWYIIYCATSIISLTLCSYIFIDSLVWVSLIGKYKLLVHRNSGNDGDDIELGKLSNTLDITNIPRSARDYYILVDKMKNRYYIISATLSLSYISYAVFCSVIVGMYHHSLLFPIISILPLFIMFSCCIISRIKVHKLFTLKESRYYGQNLFTFKILLLSSTLSLMIGSLWTLSRGLCEYKDVEWIAYTFIDVFWNILSTYTIHIIIQSIVYFRAPYLSSGPSYINYDTFKGKLFPIVDYKR